MAGQEFAVADSGNSFLTGHTMQAAAEAAKALNCHCGVAPAIHSSVEPRSRFACLPFWFPSCHLALRAITSFALRRQSEPPGRGSLPPVAEAGDGILPVTRNRLGWSASRGAPTAQILRQKWCRSIYTLHSRDSAIAEAWHCTHCFRKGLATMNYRNHALSALAAFAIAAGATPNLYGQIRDVRTGAVRSNSLSPMKPIWCKTKF